MFPVRPPPRPGDALTSSCFDQQLLVLSGEVLGVKLQAWGCMWGVGWAVGAVAAVLSRGREQAGLRVSCRRLGR